MAKKEHWKAEPDDHDYPAASDYLSLVLPAAHATALVDVFGSAPVSHRKAKDLLRASGLAGLPADNVHVAKDLRRVKRGDKLSPVLVVRGNLRDAAPLTIADGYHRVCASYQLDEDADIPCRIVDLDTAPAAPATKAPVKGRAAPVARKAPAGKTAARRAAVGGAPAPGVKAAPPRG